MKSAFYFMLKALFFLDIFAFFFLIFWLRLKRLNKKAKVDFKNYDVKAWATKILQYI